MRSMTNIGGNKARIQRQQLILILHYTANASTRLLIKRLFNRAIMAQSVGCCRMEIRKKIVTFVKLSVQFSGEVFGI